jgi:hypothetical protein
MQRAYARQPPVCPYTRPPQTPRDGAPAERAIPSAHVVDASVGLCHGAVTTRWRGLLVETATIAGRHARTTTVGRHRGAGVGCARSRSSTAALQHLGQPALRTENRSAHRDDADRMARRIDRSTRSRQVFAGRSSRLGRRARCSRRSSCLGSGTGSPACQGDRNILGGVPSLLDGEAVDGDGCARLHGQGDGTSDMALEDRRRVAELLTDGGFGDDPKRPSSAAISSRVTVSE